MWYIFCSSALKYTLDTVLVDSVGEEFGGQMVSVVLVVRITCPILVSSITSVMYYMMRRTSRKGVRGGKGRENPFVTLHR